MKVLVLHNDNLPAEILSGGEYRDMVLYVQEPFKPASESDIENYDTFVDERLDSIFTGKTFDAVVMPFSFSKYNYMEFTALRVGLHIRLTGRWNNENVPVLFLGPDRRDEVAKICEHGIFLFTSGVYTSDVTTRDGLYAELTRILAVENSLTETEKEIRYDSFLDRIRINPPADYEMEHSTSNEWTVIRWLDMFRWSSGVAPELENPAFKGMLYMKYIMATAGYRRRFREKNRKSPEIYGIEGKSFVLIDDSVDKGWESVLRAVIEKESGGILYCFKSFECAAENSITDTGTLEREELVKRISEYLEQPEISDADCYIVDLHLCEEDRDESGQELSGIDIIKRIKSMNRANQVVVFTASDSIMDLKDTFRIINAAGYTMKEDPEDNFSRGESYRIFCDFSSAIVKASRLSYLKRYVRLIDKYEPMIKEDAGLLDDIVDLLLVDRPEYTMKPAVLNLIIFLENYLKKRFSVRDDGYLYLRKGNLRLSRFDGFLFFRVKNDDGHSNVCDMMVKTGDGAISNVWIKPYNSDIRDIIVPLFFYYSIPVQYCKEIIDIKKLRNTRIAHGGGELDISAERLSGILDNVLFPVLEKDYMHRR